jgi:hypothetical protein
VQQHVASPAAGEWRPSPVHPASLLRLLKKNPIFEIGKKMIGGWGLEHSSYLQWSTSRRRRRRWTAPPVRPRRPAARTQQVKRDDGGEERPASFLKIIDS